MTERALPTETEWLTDLRQAVSGWPMGHPLPVATWLAKAVDERLAAEADSRRRLDVERHPSGGVDGPDPSTDFLRRLRAANVARLARWHGADTEPWNGADWSNAMCGEAGETANIVKKLRRLETGTANFMNGNTHAELIRKLRDEIADTVTYLDLLAWYYKIDDLAECVAGKFNAVSAREGFPDRLSVSP